MTTECDDDARCRRRRKSSPRPTPSTVTGTYESNWDGVRLVEDGDRGTYVCCGGGTIEGRIIEGRVIRDRWQQPTGWGTGVWRIDGHRLSGTWGWERDDDDGGRWDLQRRRAQLAQ